MRWKETGLVFTSTIGTPIDDGKILKEFNALAKAAGLPKQRFHALRHACCSLLRAQGVAVTEVTDSAGAAAVLDAGRFDVISTHGAPEWWIEHASQRGVPVVNVLQGLFYKDWCSDSRWA